MTDAPAPAPRLTKRQKRALVEAHLVTVAEMYLSGKSQTAIAAEINVNQSTVSRYIKRLQDRWRAASAELIDDRKARELAKIDRLEREYLEAWEKSKLDGETKIRRKKTINLRGELADGVHLEIPAEEREFSLTTRGQTGDPRYLQGVQWCVETRLKIMGGYAPVKVDVTWQEILKTNGINPSDAFEQLVAAAAAQLATADGGGGVRGGDAPPDAGPVRPVSD